MELFYLLLFFFVALRQKLLFIFSQCEFFHQFKEFFLELCLSITHLFSMGFNETMKLLNFMFLDLENFLSFLNLLVCLLVLLLKGILCVVVFVFHCQNILIDGDFVFQKIIQFIDSFSFNEFFVFQQFQFVLEVLNLLLETIDVLLLKNFLVGLAFQMINCLFEILSRPFARTHEVLPFDLFGRLHCIR